jgi:hypothetical protein
MSWSRRFDEPIELPKRGELRTLSTPRRHVERLLQAKDDFLHLGGGASWRAIGDRRKITEQASLFALCRDIPDISEDRFCGPVALAA